MAANVEDIFAQAIAMPQHDRESFVRSVCDGDERLSAEVRVLIDSHEKNQSVGFVLDFPPTVEVDCSVPPPQCGSIVGRYKLLEEIGEGGMGVVFMAEQVEGVRRRVAVKVIKLGMDTRQVIARFEAERQAMALFDHPNITKVLDAGATSAGRPYFVMELVPGRPIMDFVSAEAMELPARLALFIQICEAVHHAHQKGIIHRDLKPSNVLVTRLDGKATVKVIDFGIAKAIGQQRLTEKTLFTRFAAMMGTPRYMSPEQAELNGVDVDTRSDIYSLGVLLYELITGTTPLSEEELKETTPGRLHETIRDTEIETPSNRMARLRRKDGSVARQGRRRASTHPTELDWVVLKALSRDRSQRYASANELAVDVERFRNGEPILAAPPSRLRWIAAFARRYRGSLITGVSFFVALAAASVACLWFALQASRANQDLLETNHQLRQHVEQLQAAEARIRESSLRRQHEMAISVALAKFEIQFGEVIFELALKRFPQYLGPTQPFDEDDSGYELCMSFDPSKLLKLKFAEKLPESLQRIADVIEEDGEIMRRAYDDTPEPEDGGHTPECLQLQEMADQRLPEHRPLFYRILVDEYRRVFSESDPAVAEALQLLAASLLESDEPVEAEARLREAIAIGDDVNDAAARELLTIAMRARTETH